MADLIIDDSNYLNHIDPTINGESKSRGLLPRRTMYGAIPSIPTTTIKRIPVAEFPDRIADQERNKSSLWHVWKDSKIGTLNQNGLSYCHAFSATDALMILREYQGLPYVELSASSVGAPVTNYRNAGAWIEEDLKQMVKVGVATTEFVPMRTTKRSDFKTGWEANAELHKAALFEDGKPRDFELFVSAMLQNFPVCMGLDWWGHAVTGIRAKIVDKSKGCIVVNGVGIAPDILNSWGPEWGTDGVGTLANSKGIPDEWYVVRQATPSNN